MPLAYDYSGECITVTVIQGPTGLKGDKGDKGAKGDKGDPGTGGTGGGEVKRVVIDPQTTGCGLTYLAIGIADDLSDAPLLTSLGGAQFIRTISGVNYIPYNITWPPQYFDEILQEWVQPPQVVSWHPWKHPAAYGATDYILNDLSLPPYIVLADDVEIDFRSATPSTDFTFFAFIYFPTGSNYDYNLNTVVARGDRGNYTPLACYFQDDTGIGSINQIFFGPDTPYSNIGALIRTQSMHTGRAMRLTLEPRDISGFKLTTSGWTAVYGAAFLSRYTSGAEGSGWGNDASANPTTGLRQRYTLSSEQYARQVDLTENAISGSFTTVDGKTITVTNGLVTGIA